MCVYIFLLKVGNLNHWAKMATNKLLPGIVGLQCMQICFHPLSPHHSHIPLNSKNKPLRLTFSQLPFQFGLFLGNAYTWERMGLFSDRNLCLENVWVSI